MDPDQNSQQESMPAVTPTAPRKPVGPIVGAAIIIILMMIGALYFWGATLNKQEQNSPPLILGDDEQAYQESLQVAANVEGDLPPQSSSDEIGDIEADLGAMDMDGFASQTEGDVAAYSETN